MQARLDAMSGRTEAARTRAIEVLTAAQAEGTEEVVAQALLTLATIAREETQWQEALGFARKAATAALTADARLLAADAWLEAAELEAHEHELISSREHSANARALLTAPGFPGDRRARLRMIEGYQALQADDAAAAEPLLLEAVQALQAARGEDHHSIARVLLRVGDAQRGLGKTESALQSYDRGRMMLAARAGEAFPALWTYDYSIALAELQLKNYDTAIDRLQGALDLLAGREERFARPRAKIQVALASAAFKSGRYDEALAAAKAARAELAERVPPANPSRRSANTFVALLAIRQGEFEVAAESLREVALAHEAASDALHAADAWGQLAFTQLRRGMALEARSVLERHRTVIAAHFPDHVAGLERAIEAVVLRDGGDAAAARAAFAAARANLPGDQKEAGWCEMWAWASLELAESESPDRRRALAQEAAAHLEEHLDPILLARAKSLL